MEVHNRKCTLERGYLGTRKHSFIELQTLMLEIETILKNCLLSTDNEDDANKSFTPNHLLFGRKIKHKHMDLNVVDTSEE